MTDDGQQAVCLIRSVNECGKFDPEHFGKQLVAWLDSGPPDVGGTTARTLSALRNGKPWHEAALSDYKANPNNAANGSIMRNGVLPGLMVGEDLDALFRASVQHSIITHFAPLPTLCCAAHSWLIADLLADRKEGPLDNEDWVSNFFNDWTGYVEREDDPYVNAWFDRVGKAMQPAGDALTNADWNPFTFDPFTYDYAGRSGWVLLALQVSIWCLHWSAMADEPLSVPDGFPADVVYAARRVGVGVAGDAWLGRRYGRRRVRAVVRRCARNAAGIDDRGLGSPYGFRCDDSGRVRYPVTSRH